jgi:hypothetical protein
VLQLAHYVLLELGDLQVGMSFDVLASEVLVPRTGEGMLLITF